MNLFVVFWLFCFEDFHLLLVIFYFINPFILSLDVTYLNLLYLFVESWSSFLKHFDLIFTFEKFKSSVFGIFLLSFVTFFQLGHSCRHFFKLYWFEFRLFFAKAVLHVIFALEFGQLSFHLQNSVILEFWIFTDHFFIFLKIFHFLLRHIEISFELLFWGWQ